MMRKSNIVSIIFFLVIIIMLNGCSSKESSSKTGVGASQQDASQLTGLWRAEKAFQLNFQTQKLEERKISDLDFVEFKDGQVCVAASGSVNAYGTGKYWLDCSQYLPYTMSGDKIIVEGRTSPITTWRIIDGKLELTTKMTARDPMPQSKVTYRKLSEAEIYKTGEPVDGKVPIRVEGTPIQN